jgi:hypothetical protein
VSREPPERAFRSGWGPSNPSGTAGRTDEWMAAATGHHVGGRAASAPPFKPVVRLARGPAGAGVDAAHSVVAERACGSTPPAPVRRSRGLAGRGRSWRTRGRSRSGAFVLRGGSMVGPKIPVPKRLVLRLVNASASARAVAPLTEAVRPGATGARVLGGRGPPPNGRSEREATARLSGGCVRTSRGVQRPRSALSAPVVGPSPPTGLRWVGSSGRFHVEHPRGGCAGSWDPVQTGATGGYAPLHGYRRRRSPADLRRGGAHF